MNKHRQKQKGKYLLKLFKEFVRVQSERIAAERAKGPFGAILPEYTVRGLQQMWSRLPHDRRDAALASLEREILGREEAMHEGG